MTSPAQNVVGRCGRRAPKNAPAIKFGDILRAGVQIPPHPASEDYLAQLPSWNMLGNDQAGDCVAVTWANFRRLVTAFLSTESYPTQDQVWAIYRTQNPDFDPAGTADTNGPGSSADQGMDIQSLLEYLVKHGGPDGVKVVAFAKVDHRNETELDAALAIFGGVWTGVIVTEINEREFAQGQPWDYVPGSPQIGGHSVLAGGYTPDPRIITWATETGYTDAFRQHLVEEAWIVVWPEHLGTKQFQTGIDRDALAADYLALTGRPLPLPAPPTPTPGPPPAAADEAFATILRPWVAHHHVGENHHVQVAAQSWLASKGLA